MRTSEETPSLGVLIGRRFPFESLRRNGDGPKEAIHTTVVTGRSVVDDPKRLIVFRVRRGRSCRWRSRRGRPRMLPGALGWTCPLDATGL
jgi:hypothetical protein